MHSEERERAEKPPGNFWRQPEVRPAQYRHRDHEKVPARNGADFARHVLHSHVRENRDDYVRSMPYVSGAIVDTFLYLNLERLLHATPSFIVDQGERLTSRVRVHGAAPRANRTTQIISIASTSVGNGRSSRAISFETARVPLNLILLASLGLEPHWSSVSLRPYRQRTLLPSARSAVATPTP